MKRALVLLALAFASTACTKASPPSASPSAPESIVTSAVSSSGTKLPTSVNTVTALAFGVSLDAAGEPGNGSLKMIVDSSDAYLVVTITGLTNKNTKLCPIATLQSHDAACKIPQDNRPIRIPHGRKFKGLHVLQTKGAALLDVRVSYHPKDRKITMLLPNVNPQPGASVCKDNGCNPIFELTLRRAGTFTAVATWQGIASGTLDMETGLIAEKSYSTSGAPYHVVAKSSGNSSVHAGRLSIKGYLDATTEAAVALRNDGARPLLSPIITISWP
ncbi:MAG: hypothetical protein ACYDCC_08550 [Actinomycetota bacterium]